MAKVSDFYGGSYLSGSELAGKSYNLQIANVAAEEVGEQREQKLVVSFAGAQKALVLNKSNASTLASAHGDDTGAWIGKWVELFTIPVTFGGRNYDGLRVRSIDGPAQPAAPTAAPAPQSALASAQPSPAPSQPAQQPAARPIEPAELEQADAIPF